MYIYINTYTHSMYIHEYFLTWRSSTFPQWPSTPSAQIYIYIYIYIYIHIYIYIYIYMCVCVCVCVCSHVHVHIHIHTYIYIFIYIYIYLGIYTYTFMYMYIYIHTYTRNMYIYTYFLTWRSSNFPQWPSTPSAQRSLHDVWICERKKVEDRGWSEQKNEYEPTC